MAAFYCRCRDLEGCGAFRPGHKATVFEYINKFDKSFTTSYFVEYRHQCSRLFKSATEDQKASGAEGIGEIAPRVRRMISRIARRRSPIPFDLSPIALKLFLTTFAIAPSTS